VLSLLMVSKIRYNALPKLKDKNFPYKVILFITLIGILILALVNGGEILFYLLIAVVLFVIVRKFYYLLLNKKDENGNKKSENKIV